MRMNKTDEAGVKIMGDVCMGDLYHGGNVMIPFVICPHGAFGPSLLNFLFHYDPIKPMEAFPANRPYAQMMYDRATSAPCPLGIVTTACINWKNNKTRTFYGHSYTAPSPREYTLGKLGLAIVKGYAMHLRNAMKKLGNKPPNNRRFNGAATTTDMSHNPTNNPTNREPVDAAI